jgi:hypothetical protein
MPEVWEHPALNVKMSMAAPWEAMLEVQEHPPPILKTSMAGSLGAMPEVYEHPPPILKTSMVAPLGVRPSSVIRRCAMTYIGDIDRSNSSHGSHSPYA